MRAACDVINENSKQRLNNNVLSFIVNKISMLVNNFECKDTEIKSDLINFANYFLL